MTTRLVAVYDALGHRFEDPAVLLQACTHASFCDAQASDAERRENSNERLEFLGDTLLGAAIGLQLYEKHPSADEGALSRLRSRLVSRQALARAIEQHNLLDHCRVGSQMKAPWPDSVKANLAEALLAAVYMDGGWEALVTAVDRLLGSQVTDLPPAPAADTKNDLQAWALEHHQALPTYDTERCGGSDHAPQFRCVVTIADHSGEGIGTSRRRAEAAAARDLLDHIGTTH